MIRNRPMTSPPVDAKGPSTSEAGVVRPHEQVPNDIWKRSLVFLVEPQRAK
jgi:hypothetical protein